MSEKADIYHSEKATTAHIDYSDEKNLGVSGSEQELGHFIADASAAAELQKSQTTRAALAMWKPAIIWSIIFSSAIIMEGYDTILLVSVASLLVSTNANELVFRANSGPSLLSRRSMVTLTRGQVPIRSLLPGKPGCPAPFK